MAAEINLLFFQTIGVINVDVHILRHSYIMWLLLFPYAYSHQEFNGFSTIENFQPMQRYHNLKIFGIFGF